MLNYRENCCTPTFLCLCCIWYFEIGACFNELYNAPDRCLTAFLPPGRLPTSRKLQASPRRHALSRKSLLSHFFLLFASLFLTPASLHHPALIWEAPCGPLSQRSLPVLLYPMGGTHYNGLTHFLVGLFLQEEYHSNHDHQCLQRACHIVGPQRKIWMDRWIQWASVLKSLAFCFSYQWL